MKYHFYTTSETAWDGLFDAMRSARKSIYLEMYIFIDDTKENDFISLLAEKARGGVSVKMVLDIFGSFSLSNNAQKILRDAGVELLFFRKWFRRLHKKIVVVDQTIGFLGGVNIHRDARSWTDLLIRLEGKIVHSLIQSFRRTYRACGGKDGSILTYKQKSILGRTRLWLFEHLPEIRKTRLRDVYTDAISKAEHSIVLVTPYFLPHKWLIELFKKVRRQNIRVEILVPLKTDSSFLTRANRYFMNHLGSYGITFYQAPNMNHAKLLLIDEKLAFVGSQNIDAMSFDFNAEIGIFFDDPKMLRELSGIVDGWKAQSKIFLPVLRMTLADKLLSFFIRSLQPLL